ncbi:MAG: hypothetical protein ACI89U_002666 [Gammaproteobacteria bacterium]|jgi:hypothetical protein
MSLLGRVFILTISLFVPTTKKEISLHGTIDVPGVRARAPRLAAKKSN